MATLLRTSKCLHRIAWPRKPTPRIKVCVASYHTTKVITHQTSRPFIANCVPKLVAMAMPLSTHGAPSNTWFPQPIRAHNRNGIPIGSSVFAQMTVVSLYFTMGRPFSPKNLPLPMGGSGPHLIHGSPGPPKSSTHTAARSVQPFLQGSLVWQTDRPTDHATRSVRIGRIYVCSTAMRPNNNNNNNVEPSNIVHWQLSIINSKAQIKNKQ